MTNSDTSSFQWRDMTAALGLLTRLPVRVDGDWAAQRGAAAAWAYPLVGLIVGLISGAVALVACWLGLPTSVQAGVAVLTAVMVTGALHEDGLADCADGFWGSHDRARRLEIMKDSRIGAYGVLALVFGIGLRWVGLWAARDAGLFWVVFLVPAMASRAAMVWVMAALPLARDTGLSRVVGQPAGRVALAAATIAAAATLVMTGMSVAAVALVAAAMCLAVMALARAKIGGQTGDVLGGTQQVVEIAVLMTLLVT